MKKHAMLFTRRAALTGFAALALAGPANAATVNINAQAKRSGNVIRCSVRVTATGSFEVNGMSLLSLNINNVTLGAINVPIDGKAVTMAANVGGVRLASTLRLTNGKVEVKVRGIAPNGQVFFRRTRRVTVVG